MFFKKDKVVPNEQNRLIQQSYREGQPTNEAINQDIANVPDNTKQVFQDISHQLQKNSPYPFVNQQETIPCYMYPLVDSASNIKFPTLVKQIVIYNPSAWVINLNDETIIGSGAAAVNYKFKVNAFKVQILPYFPCRELFYVVSSGYTAFNPLPTLFAYAEPLFTPIISAI